MDPVGLRSVVKRKEDISIIEQKWGWSMRGGDWVEKKVALRVGADWRLCGRVYRHRLDSRQ